MHVLFPLFFTLDSFRLRLQQPLGQFGAQQPDAFDDGEVDGGKGALIWGTDEPGCPAEYRFRLCQNKCSQVYLCNVANLSYGLGQGASMSRFYDEVGQRTPSVTTGRARSVGKAA